MPSPLDRYDPKVPSSASHHYVVSVLEYHQRSFRTHRPNGDCRGLKTERQRREQRAENYTILGLDPYTEWMTQRPRASVLNDACGLLDTPNRSIAELSQRLAHIKELNMICEAKFLLKLWRKRKRAGGFLPPAEKEWFAELQRRVTAHYGRTISSPSEVNVFLTDMYKRMLNYPANPFLPAEHLWLQGD